MKTAYERDVKASGGFTSVAALDRDCEPEFSKLRCIPKNGMIFSFSIAQLGKSRQEQLFWRIITSET
jgi:hypothetical protein